MNKASNDTASEFVREQIRATVKDPKTAALLCPNDHPIGTKRLILDTNYYETYNRPNVTLVDARSAPIKEITPTGLRTADGEFELDAIVFATGFDAMTGAMKEIDIHTDAGASIDEKWEDGPHTYLGIMMAGFPNLFMITGPQSPGVKSQMIFSCEQHVDWIADCLTHVRGEGRIASRRRRRGRLGAAQQRGRRRHALSAGQVLVHGRQHPGQAARLHALCRRRHGLQKEVRRGRRERLRGVHAGELIAGFA